MGRYKVTFVDLNNVLKINLNNATNRGKTYRYKKLLTYLNAIKN